MHDLAVRSLAAITRAAHRLDFLGPLALRLYLVPVFWVAGMNKAAGERLSRARELLEEHGDYEWLTEQGSFVVSNSGIEWAGTYFVMLLALFATGGGRYISADDWIRRRLAPASVA
jgi:uncharacterized membrane protein YphA (DoxX/SURF4 family)